MPNAAVLPAAAPDSLVPDAQVCREFAITRMTLHRWGRDPGLGFPPAIQIRGRNFRSRAAIEHFKSRLWRDALKRRA